MFIMALFRHDRAIIEITTMSMWPGAGEGAMTPLHNRTMEFLFGHMLNVTATTIICLIHSVFYAFFFSFAIRNDKNVGVQQTITFIIN